LNAAFTPFGFTVCALILIFGLSVNARRGRICKRCVCTGASLGLHLHQTRASADGRWRGG